MAKTQWLLIGGTDHGKTLWIKGGTAVIGLPLEHNHEISHYRGHDYIHAGAAFRVGLCNPTPEEYAEIPPLIVATQLAPLGGV